MLITLCCLLLLSSCTQKRIEFPSVEGVGLKERIAELSDIKYIEAALEVDYEKDGVSMRGDGALRLSEDNLTLRMYFHGFMVGEISENRGVVTSVPKLNKARSAMLVDGLRSGFFWWSIRDYSVEERDDAYVLSNYNRKISLDKKTLLPLRQTLDLYDGDKLDIYYDSPVKAAEDEEGPGERTPVLKLGDRPLWYQSGMRIEIGKNIVKVKVKSYEAFR